MERKNKKILFIILPILVLYIVGMYFVVSFFQDKNSYFAVSYISTWKYNGKKWQDITWEELKDKKFNVYDSGNKIGKYQLQYNDKLFIFDDKSKIIPYEGEIFAYSGSKNINIMNFAEEEFKSEDMDYLEDALLENGYNYIKYNLTMSDLDLKQKMTINLDGDWKKETIYSISNIYSSAEEVFSIVYIVDGKNITIVNFEKNSSLEALGTYTYSLKYFFKMGFSKYNFIIERNLFSQPEETCHSMYKYSKNNIERLIGC